MIEIYKINVRKSHQLKATNNSDKLKPILTTEASLFIPSTAQEHSIEMLDSLKEQTAKVFDAVKVQASTTSGQAADQAGDCVDSCVAKAKDAVTDTGDWIKKVAGDFFDMVSSTLGELLDTIEDNPLYLGLLGIAVFLLYIGIYFIFTRQSKKKDVEEWEERDERSTSSEVTDKAGNPVDSFVAKAKDMAADTGHRIKKTAANTRDRIKKTAANFQKKVSTTFEKAAETVEDKPGLYLGLLGIAVIFLSLGAYIFYVRE